MKLFNSVIKVFGFIFSILIFSILIGFLKIPNEFSMPLLSLYTVIGILFFILPKNENIFSLS